MRQKPVSTLTDKEILQMISENDQSAWEEIIYRYKDTVYSALYYMLKNNSDVEDAFQNTFLRIKKSASQFRYGKSARKWIKTVASREALQIMRRRRAYDISHTMLNETNTPIDKRSADSDVSEDEIRNILRREIARLPDIIRTVVTLKFYSEMTQKEIASELNSYQRTVSNRIQKGLDMLGQRLALSGINRAYVLTPALIGSTLSEKHAPTPLVKSMISRTVGSAGISTSSGSGLFTVGKGLAVAAIGIVATTSVFVGYYRKNFEAPTQVPGFAKDRILEEEVFHFDFEKGLNTDFWRVITVQSTKKEGLVVVDLPDTPAVQVITSDKFGAPSQALRLQKQSSDTSVTGIVFKDPISPGYTVTMEMDAVVQECKFYFQVGLGDTKTQEQLFTEKKLYHENKVNKFRIEYVPEDGKQQNNYIVRFHMNGTLYSQSHVAIDSTYLAIMVQKGGFLVDNVTLSFTPLVKEKK